MLKIMLFIICVFFILQFDAYFYLTDTINITPNLQILITFSLLSLFCLFFKKFKLRTFSKEGVVFLFGLSIYILIQIVSILKWDTIPEKTHILFFWAYMLILLSMGYIIGSLTGKRVPYFMFSILVVLFVLTIFDTLYGGISISQLWGRSAATLRNPNTVGAVAVLLFLGSIRWRQLKWFEFFASIIAGAIIVLSRTRGGILDYAALIFCLAIWWSKGSGVATIRYNKIIISTIIGILIVVTLTCILISSRYGGKDNIITTALSDTNGRDQVAITAMELIDQKPIFGYGTGFVYTQEKGPHNMLLRAWLESGIAGPLGLFALAFGTFWIGITRKDPSIIILTIILGVMAMTTHNLTESRSLLIITGILLADSSRRKYSTFHHNRTLSNKINIVVT